MRNPLIWILLSFSSLIFGENLVKNGEFTEWTEDGHPAVWKVSHPNHLANEVVVVKQGADVDNGKVVTFLQVVKNSRTVNVEVGSQEILIPEGTEALRIRAKMRGIGLIEGEQAWQMAGIGVTYFTPSGAAKPGEMGKWIKLPRLDSDWVEYDTVVPVRDASTRASVGFVSQGWSGTLEVQWIRVEAVAPTLP